MPIVAVPNAAVPIAAVPIAAGTVENVAVNAATVDAVGDSRPAVIVAGGPIGGCTADSMAAADLPVAATTAVDGAGTAGRAAAANSPCEVVRDAVDSA